MFKNNLKFAFRNLWRHKAFSAINIIGLSVGMTAGLLIFMYVRFELSYDSFHKKADRIYRVVSDIKTPTEVINASGPSWAVAPNVKQAFPQVEAFVRLSGESMLVRKGNIKFQEEKSLYADSAFFQVFDFKLLRGNPRTALTEPLSIVFSESAAKKYFGSENPIGQSLLLTGEGLPGKVTGVMKDLPENSQVKADMLISMSTLTKRFNAGLDDQWGNYGATVFLLLKPGTSAAQLEKQFPAFLEERNGKEMKQYQMYPTLFLEPLKDVYLHSTRDGSKTGNMNNVYIFSIIAVLTLLIACINFVNLTTARAAERAKEVGVRKVVGADRGQLTRHFLGESVIVCLIAFVITLISASLLLPLFNQLAGKIISKGIFTTPSYVAILFFGAIGVGVLAGLYPALVLSGFQPVVVLNGRFSTSSRGIVLRKGLVVTQFTMSIALIIATIGIYNQMKYVRSHDLGFNKNQMVVINTNGDPGGRAFEQSLTQIPGVQSTTMSGSIPGGGNPGAYSEIENIKGDLQIANLDLYFVDFNYIEHFKMKMAAGRSFSKDFGTDTTQAMVLNEAAVKMFGYSSPEQAVGKRFKQWGREGKIIGVMKDFHYRSLQENIKPLTMRIEPGAFNIVSANVASNNIKQTLSAIEKKWEEFIPNRPFSYYFLDEFFDRQYRSELRFGSLFLNFAILAIILSCLGLLGLSSYSTLQRTREIGMRKVMGASVPNIVKLLSSEFLKLVLIAFVIASPIAWFAMYKWLQNFSYRMPLGWQAFLLAGITAVVIAFITISFQAIKAAVANPVKSLRSVN